MEREREEGEEGGGGVVEGLIVLCTVSKFLL